MTIINNLQWQTLTVTPTQSSVINNCIIMTWLFHLWTLSVDSIKIFQLKRLTLSTHLRNTITLHHSRLDLEYSLVSKMIPTKYTVNRYKTTVQDKSCSGAYRWEGKNLLVTQFCRIHLLHIQHLLTKSVLSGVPCQTILAETNTTRRSASEKNQLTSTKCALCFLQVKWLFFFKHTVRDILLYQAPFTGYGWTSAF